MPERQWGDSNGFTLIEALLAMALLSIAIFGTFSLLDSVMGYNKFAETITTATTLAQDKVEELKNTDYSLITAGTENDMDDDGTVDAGGIYRRITTVVEDDTTFTPTKIKIITTEVQWSWKGNQKDLVLKTIIKN